MEWSGFMHAEWSSDENRAFENALAECSIYSTTFFRDLASRFPWRSTEDVHKHYQDLMEDVQKIESGLVPFPNYVNASADQEANQRVEGGSSSSSHSKKNDDESSSGSQQQQRRRGVPWTEQEHQLFLMGLNKYGKGDWRSISRYYVVTKTPTQVASHAQKYFRRLNSSTPVYRRRPSIHDIHTVCLTSPSSSPPSSSSSS